MTTPSEPSPTTKHCNKCGTEKALPMFATHPGKKDGLQPFCRECQAKARREWQLKNTEEIRRKDRERSARLRAEREAARDGTGQALPPVRRLVAVVESNAALTLHAIAPNPGSASPPLGEGGGEREDKKENETVSTSTSDVPALRDESKENDQAAFGGSPANLERLPALSVNSSSDATTNAARFADLPHAAIVRSKTNPRTHFDAAFIADLAADIGRKGVLQPILVRPLPGDRLQETLEDLLPGQPRPTHEIVAGEQRWRASGIAGLRTIPALIRALTDNEVLEVQLVENLKRRDLHAMEEAEGYERLRETAGLSAEQIAERIGKGRSYVYETMSLLRLIPEARDAFYAGGLTRSTAGLLARYAAHLQPAILKDLTAQDHLGEPMSYRKAKEHVENAYMLRLAAAPFDTADAQLVPGAGPCGTCPRRSGSSPQLFPDIASADTCTDPTCFAGKKDAHYAALQATATAQGKALIVGKEAREIVQADGTLQGYTRLDEKVDTPAGFRSLRGVLGEGVAVSETTLIEHPTTRELIEAMPWAEASRLLRVPAAPSSGPAPAAPAPAPAPMPPATPEQLDAKALTEAYERRWRTLAIRRVVEDTYNTAAAPSIDAQREIAVLLLEGLQPASLAVVADLAKVGQVGRREGVADHLRTVPADAVTRWIHVIAMAHELHALDAPARVVNLIAHDHGIDGEDVRQRVKQDMKAEAAEKAPPAPPAPPAAPARKAKIKPTLDEFNALLAAKLREAGDVNAFAVDERVRIRTDITKGVDTFNTRGMQATVIDREGERSWQVQPDGLNFPITVDYTEIEPC